jgi:hypothetical protein
MEILRTFKLSQENPFSDEWWAVDIDEYGNTDEFLIGAGETQEEAIIDLLEKKLEELEQGTEDE